MQRFVLKSHSGDRVRRGLAAAKLEVSWVERPKTVGGSRVLRSCAMWSAVLAGGAMLLASGASAAPFDPSPGATWQTNGRVRSILYVGNTVYIAGEFTQVVP